MPLFRGKGTVTMRFVQVGYTDTEVDEEVEAESEKAAQSAVLDRISEEEDYEMPSMFDYGYNDEGESQLHGWNFKTTEIDDGSPEAQSRIAVRQMMEYGVGSLLEMT